MPLILVIFWFYFMVPLVVGRPVGAFASATIAFVLFESAYDSEIIRGGLASVRPGQTDAARACGMGRFAALRHVVLPQAFRAMLPVFLTQAIVLFQDTSLVFVVPLHDFLTAATIMANRDGTLVGTYLGACLVYYLVCARTPCWSAACQYGEPRQRARPGRSAPCRCWPKRPAG